MPVRGVKAPYRREALVAQHTALLNVFDRQHLVAGVVDSTDELLAEVRVLTQAITCRPPMFVELSTGWSIAG